MVISIMFHQQQKDGEVHSVEMLDYGRVLEDSFAGLFALPSYNNIITQKWHEYSGEEVDFSLATPAPLSFKIKFWGKVAKLGELVELLNYSVGGSRRQKIMLDYGDTDRMQHIFAIPAEFQKASSFKALSRNGDLSETYASVDLEFKVFENEYEKESYNFFHGILSDWKQNGSVGLSGTPKKSLSDSKYYFYEMSKNDINRLIDTNDYLNIRYRNEYCLNRWGWTVLKGYYQSAYTPLTQNDALNLKYIGSEEEQYRLMSDKSQARDVKILIANKQDSMQMLVDIIGLLKRWIHRVIKHTENYIVFYDEDNELALKCYVKACNVKTFKFDGYVEMELTLRAEEVKRIERVETEEEEEAPPALEDPEEYTPPVPTYTPPKINRQGGFCVIGMPPVFLSVGNYDLFANNAVNIYRYDRFPLIMTYKWEEISVLYSDEELEQYTYEYKVPAYSLVYSEPNRKMPKFGIYGTELEADMGFKIKGIVTEDITFLEILDGTYENKIVRSGYITVPKNIGLYIKTFYVCLDEGLNAFPEYQTDFADRREKQMAYRLFYADYGFLPWCPENTFRNHPQLVDWITHVNVTL